jgi:hypothetical protein
MEEKDKKDEELAITPRLHCFTEKLVDRFSRTV